MTINEKLRRFAQTHKMSEIARRAGLAPNSASKYLAGSTPSYRIAFALARALSVCPLWLLDDNRNWPPVFVSDPHFHETIPPAERSADTAGHAATAAGPTGQR